MDWTFALLLIVGSLIIMMLSGMPIAFGFLVVNIMGAFLFLGGIVGLKQLIYNTFASLNMFALLPLPLFILMGEVLFHSGVAPHMLDALDKWLGRVPGRLSLLAVGCSTLFATLSGSGMANVALLGSTLAPEMEKRGYKKAMTLGPILGSAGLAQMIPPSTLAVLLGAIAGISIGSILVAIIVPGLIMAAIFAAYILVRCTLQPSLAPTYEVPPTPLLEKLVSFVQHILPAGFIIFLVTGVIFTGVATPTEAAAMGAFGTFILAAAHRKLNWGIAKKSIMGTTRITVMMFMIIAGALPFSQILVMSGASRGVVEYAVGLPLSPIMVLVMMQIILLIMGTFMDVVAMMMVTIPLYMPIISALGFNEVWFAVIILLNMDMGAISPPFGLNLFVMKGVAPPGTTMGDIYKASFPFLLCDLLAMALFIAFPSIALWLPGLIR
ncbi:TRAP transporter large permease subunit [Chloroflexota bacterium]